MFKLLYIRSHSRWLTTFEWKGTRGVSHHLASVQSAGQVFIVARLLTDSLPPPRLYSHHNTPSSTTTNISTAYLTLWCSLLAVKVLNTLFFNSVLTFEKWFFNYYINHVFIYEEIYLDYKSRICLVYNEYYYYWLKDLYLITSLWFKSKIGLKVSIMSPGISFKSKNAKLLYNVWLHILVVIL